MRAGGEQEKAMHICVIGAGALGKVYGVRLAVGGERVSFLVRTERLADEAPFSIELITGTRRRDTIATPTRVAEVPDDADVLLLAVRVDQIDDRLAGLLKSAPKVPVVSLTPLLPKDYEQLDAMLGAPGILVAAQSGVVSYDREGIVRYWLPNASPTLIDASGPREPISALVEALNRAGVPTKLAPNVREANPATSISFFPLVLALDAAGGTAASVLENKDVTKDAFAAMKEARELAQKVGPMAPWAGLLLKFVSPLSLKVGIRLAEKAAPEAVGYVEHHFGHKVHAQNVKMGREIVELGRQKGVAMPAFERLVERAEGRG